MTDDSLKLGWHKYGDFIRGGDNADTNIAGDASFHGRRIRRYMLDHFPTSFQHSLQRMFHCYDLRISFDVFVVVQEEQEDVH